MRYQLLRLSLVILGLGVWPSLVHANTSISLGDFIPVTTDETHQYVGTAIALADINGDGYNDQFIGGPQAGKDHNGIIYLQYGKSKKFTSIDLDNAIQFTGERSSDQLGSAIANVGDINGDGITDVVFGVSLFDSGTNSSAGALYIVYGQTTKYTGGSISQFIRLVGTASDSQLGYAVAGAGDVNGDGLSDIIAGAPNHSGKAGLAYLIYGQVANLTAGSVANTGAVEFSGENSNDYAGYSLSSNDLNGDHFSDLIIGAYRNDSGGSNTGAVYIVYGQVNALTDADLSTKPRLTGEANNDRAGIAVAGAGDMNGDGFGDLMIGSIYNDEGAVEGGAAYLVYGRSTELTSQALGNFAKWYGAFNNHYVGYAMVGLSDVTGDGYDEMLISAPARTNGQYGSVYLLLGQSAQFTGSRSINTLSDYTAENLSNYTGAALATGDINGDGDSDLLIAARDNNTTQGKVYLGYWPIRNCENSVSTGGILADYPTENWKWRKYKANRKLKIVVERKGRSAYLVNCFTDEIEQTLEFNKTSQQKLLARVFTSQATPLFIVVTRTPNRRRLKIFLYKQNETSLEQVDFIKRHARPRGLRLNVKHRHRIEIAMGQELKFRLNYKISADLLLEEIL